MCLVSFNFLKCQIVVNEKYFLYMVMIFFFCIVRGNNINYQVVIIIVRFLVQVIWMVDYEFVSKCGKQIGLLNSKN